MHGAVAVRATTQECPRLVSLAWNLRLDLLAGNAGEVLGDRRIAGNPGSLKGLMVRIVHRMAANAEHRLGGREQIRSHCAVRRVTSPAIFRCRGMLVDPRTHEILMAACTTLIGASGDHAWIFVRVVTTRAGHTPLGHRMMAGVTKLGAHVRVALNTKLGGRIHIGKARALEFAQGEPAPIVRVVTIAADQARLGVPAQSPLQMGVAPRCMTGQTVSAPRMPNIGDRLTLRVQAPAPMAALAIRVIDRHGVLSVDVFVADSAFLRAFGKGAYDGLGPPRTHRGPHHRRAGNAKDEGQGNEKRQLRGQPATSSRFIAVV